MVSSDDATNLLGTVLVGAVAYKLVDNLTQPRTVVRKVYVTRSSHSMHQRHARSRVRVVRSVSPFELNVPKVFQ